MSQEIVVDDRKLSWFERYNPGSHVAGWASIVKERGGESETLLNAFWRAFISLNLHGVAVAVQGVKLSGYFSEERNQIVIHKEIGKDNRRVKSVITVAIRENERGDLLCSWFLFERDWATAYLWFIYTAIVFLLGLFFVIPLITTSSFQYLIGTTSAWGSFLIFWVLVMGYLAGRGLGMWGRLYKTSPANPYERFDSAVLARYVDMTLKDVLAQAGVADNEIEEVRFADASWIEERRERREK